VDPSQYSGLQAVSVGFEMKAAQISANKPEARDKKYACVDANWQSSFGSNHVLLFGRAYPTWRCSSLPEHFCLDPEYSLS
jgi:hypothetical protein